MDDLLLHTLTRTEINNVISSGHHAVGLVGPYGAGKGYVASHLAETWLGSKSSAGSYIVKPIDGAITIDMVRDLKAFLKLKFPGDAEVRRVVIIEDAQTMTIEAQNAILKLLEEPPEDARFVLTVDGKYMLKPTIYSRLQSIVIRPTDLEMAILYFSAKGYKTEDIRRAFLISRGYAGLCSALLEDTEHVLTIAIAEAKRLLGSTAYERLLKTETYFKDKESLKRLLFAMKRVLGAATAQNDSKDRLIRQLRSVHAAESKLNSNANTKLLLTDLFLHL